MQQSRLGVLAQTGLYVGEDTKFTPIPTFTYEGERFFLRGLYGGMHLYKDNSFNVSAIVNATIESLDVDDLSRSELAKHHLSKAQLEDRDASADAGLEVIWKGKYGVLSTQALGDIGNASDAATAKVNYQYFWRLDNQWTVIPNVGATWLSEDRADYYYGTLDSEVVRGVEKYRPGSVVIPHVSLGLHYDINKKWQTSALVTYKMLPDDIKDSPIIDEDGETSFFLGVSRKF